MGLSRLHSYIFVGGAIPLFLFFLYLTSHELQKGDSLLRIQDSKQIKSHVSQFEKLSSTPRHSNQTMKPSSSCVSLNPVIIANDSNNQSQTLTSSASSNGTSILSSYSSCSFTSPLYQMEPMDANTHICPNMGHNLKVLIAITSATNHGNARLAIRETWGHWALRKDVAIAFMVGATSNKTLNDGIEQEQDTFGDIIREKFMDTFDNLTNKSIKMLEWVSGFCPKALFVLKTDDDVFINVDRLLTFVAKHKPGQRAIYGRVARKWKADRRKKSKYYISQKRYKQRRYPDFTTGPAYLIPAQIAKEVHLASLNQTFLKLEDVYITGIVASALKIKRVHVPEFVNRRIPFTSCNIKKIISVHRVKSFEQYDLWKKQHDVVKCK